MSMDCSCLTAVTHPTLTSTNAMHHNQQDESAQQSPIVICSNKQSMVSPQYVWVEGYANVLVNPTGELPL